MSEYNKAWAALIMAALMLVELYFGVRVLGSASEEAVLSILAILTPLVVWAVPNFPRAARTP